GRRSVRAARPSPGVRRAPPERRGPDPAAGRGERRARPHHQRVPLVAAGRGSSRGVRSEPRSGPDRVPVRGEPQLLRRALVPDAITEPMTIMLWGITTERVREWAADSTGDGATLTGFAGSPGAAEGPARVILEVERLAELQPGEILVAPVTSPSWTPVFGKI